MHYPQQTVLFAEGQAPEGVFLLRSGRVKLTVSSRHGRNLFLGVVGAGELLGLGASVSGKAHELTASTLSPCEALFIPREDFLRFLRERPQVCVEVVRLLSDDLDAAYERMRDLRRH